MDNKFLSWFLGPKAENSNIFINTLLEIVQDYTHWRKNYFPDDNILVTKKLQREYENEFDLLEQNVNELLSQLRRNFPFYSPRYIAHMLSDITLPSLLGYFAGMLYNSNNVTPEAAPVTVEMEIDACNEVLKMIGFKPSPSPPLKDAPKIQWETYEKELKTEFGWAHITSGGTIANIEALWVARSIKYFPLSIREASIQNNLNVSVKNASGNEIDIKLFLEKDIINIKPNESIYLFSKFIETISNNFHISIEQAGLKATELLSNTKYNISNHLGNIFRDFPPVVFVSGTAHYSIKKAADLLGIGRNNIVLVKTTEQFQIDINDLELKIKKALSENKIPLAVISIASTTEEGAVDPLHQIIDLRKKFEEEFNVSFWVHVDSAWGGYINTILKLEPDEECEIIIDKINTKFGIDASKMNLKKKIKALFNLLTNKLIEIKPIETNRTHNQNTQNTNDNKTISVLDIYIGKINEIFTNFDKDYYDFIINLKKVLIDYGYRIGLDDGTPIINIIDNTDFIITLTDRADSTAEYVSDTIVMETKPYKKEKKIKWGGKPLISSFLAFRHADSVTIDPHKLGYVQYPCGIIAFRNDRVRHFIMQKAPYITSSSHNVLLHNPPKHIRDISFEKLKNFTNPYDEYSIGIDAFAPFILEGSKPGAAATALWLSIKTIPLNRRNHGQIIKNTILSARELYEWLSNWENIIKAQEPTFFNFVTFGIPDTNVVIFSITHKIYNSLECINKLTMDVYNTFSIQAELGSKDYSYSQPFFLSKTVASSPQYHFDTFKSVFEKHNIKDPLNSYIDNGILILRATVMNPYILSIKQNTKQNLIRDFVHKLHKVANDCCKKLNGAL